MYLCVGDVHKLRKYTWKEGEVSKNPKLLLTEAERVGKNLT